MAATRTHVVDGPRDSEDTASGQFAGESQLARGLATLELVASGLSRITDVANELKIHRSTALRLLRQLEQLGYVRRDPHGVRYELVIERLAWMAAPLGEAECLDVYRPILEKLRTRTGEASILAMPAAGVMIYVSFFPSRSSIGVQERLGTLRPIYSSAVGKAWLAGLSDDRLVAELGRLDYVGGTARAATDADQMRAQVYEARRLGWATDVEETLPGVVCVAVPAWFRSTLIGAVSISAPTSRVGEHELEEVGRLLVESCWRSSLTTPPISGQ